MRRHWSLGIRFLATANARIDICAFVAFIIDLVDNFDRGGDPND